MDCNNAHGAAVLAAGEKNHPKNRERCGSQTPRKILGAVTSDDDSVAFGNSWQQ